MKLLTLVTVLKVGSGKDAQTMGYVFIANDYSIVTLSESDLQKELSNRKNFTFANVALDGEKIISTNGSLDKYTKLDITTNKVIGKASPVVINRIEVNGKLAGYTIFNAAGILQEVDVATAVRIHAETPFANGKIRHTQEGDIIQSIEGNYPIREFKLASKAKEEAKLTIDLVFIGSAIFNSAEATKPKVIKYMGLIVQGENAAHIAKLYDTLYKSNTKLIKEAKEFMDAAKAEEVYGLKRTGSAGVYGVFDLHVAFRLIELAGNKVFNGIGKIMVSTVDYTVDGESETIILLDHKLNAVKKQAGSEKSDKLCEKYVEELKRKLEGIVIE